MELRGRVQKANETLQGFALEIERLLQLAYPFVNGIRDPEIKHAVCATPNLRTTTGEAATLHGKVNAKVTIANLSVYCLQPEILVWARLEGDCEDNSLWVVEPVEIKGTVGP
ncbi:hypothetical protein CVS40_9889 [Lucilia cuprina]|nr:hypothetical protein CVS40_9889 [Lucilia cuprina]